MLRQLLFDADAAILGMALTALANLLTAAADAVAIGLLRSGTPLAIFALFSHTDGSVRDHATAVCVQMCKDATLAGALAESGAATFLSELIGSSAPDATPPLAQAVRSMIEDNEGARTAALAAGGAAALGAALLGCTDADGRLTIALTIAALVRGDWAALQAAAGWAAVVAVLSVVAASVSPTMAAFADAAALPLLTAVDDDHALGHAPRRPAGVSSGAPQPPRPAPPPTGRACLSGVVGGGSSGAGAPYVFEDETPSLKAPQVKSLPGIGKHTTYTDLD